MIRIIIKRYIMGFTKEAIVLTDQGLKYITDLPEWRHPKNKGLPESGVKYAVWDGSSFINGVTIRKSNIQPIFRVDLSDNTNIIVSIDHLFIIKGKDKEKPVNVLNLNIGDSINSIPFLLKFPGSIINENIVITNVTEISYIDSIYNIIFPIDIDSANISNTIVLNLSIIECVKKV